MKNQLKNILIILLISTISAIFYNFYSSKPLPFIKEIETVKEVSDSIFFINDIENKIDTLKSDTNKILTKTKLDTSKTNDNSETKKLNDDNTKAEKKENLTISFKQLKRVLNNPNYIIIDARNSDLYEAGHIGNAINIHPYWQPNDYFSKLTSLPKDKTIIVYCDGGTCDLSHHVERDLRNFGYERVFVFIGGWDEWKKNLENQ